MENASKPVPWDLKTIDFVNEMLDLASVGPEISTEGDKWAMMAFRLIRKHGLGLYLQPSKVGTPTPEARAEVESMQESPPEVANPDEYASARAITMPFGKYRLSTLGEIADKDTGYIRWLAHECNLRDEGLREAVLIVWRGVSGEQNERG